MKTFCNVHEGTGGEHEDCFETSMSTQNAKDVQTRGH